MPGEAKEGRNVEGGEGTLEQGVWWMGKKERVEEEGKYNNDACREWQIHMNNSPHEGQYGL